MNTTFDKITCILWLLVSMGIILLTPVHGNQSDFMSVGLAKLTPTVFVCHSLLC